MRLEPMTVTYGDVRKGDIVADGSTIPGMFGLKVLSITREGESVGLSLTCSAGLASSADNTLTVLRKVV